MKSVPLPGHTRRSLTAAEVRQRREVAYYRFVHAVPLAPPAVFAEISKRFGYAVSGDWRRARCAALAAACMELELAQKTFSGGWARHLVAERFHGLRLGRDSQGKMRLLSLNQLTLWRVSLIWQRGGKISPALLDWKTFNCGRRPKVRTGAKRAAA